MESVLGGSTLWIRLPTTTYYLLVYLFHCAPRCCTTLDTDMLSKNNKYFLKTGSSNGCSLLNPGPTFIEVVSDPLGDHEYDHDGEAVGHVPRRLDQDDGQRDGHPHHASCHHKDQIKTVRTHNRLQSLVRNPQTIKAAICILTYI